MVSALPEFDREDPNVGRHGIRSMGTKGRGLGWFIVIACLVSCESLIAEEPLVLLEQAAVRAAVARGERSVVQVETVGGLEAVDGLPIGQGPGSGVILDKAGHVLTSSLAFARKPTAILVRLTDGNMLPAKLLAIDSVRKLALLKVDPPADWTIPEIVPRDEIQVGAWAIAIGRAFETARPSISTGIVSAVNRIWGRAVQTDAKISPLNYGGALIDLRGRVIGVLTPLGTDGGNVTVGTEWYDSGIGFAIPLADLTTAQLDRLKRGEDLKPGLMGITLRGQNVYADKPVVAYCASGSPAAIAGLKAGDMLTEVEGVPVRTQSEVRHAMGRLFAGDTVRITASRGEETWRGEFSLVESIPPFDPPFLGILPEVPLLAKANPEAPVGVVVRRVYPAGPAAKAGLSPGDRITEIAGQAFPTPSAARERLAAELPGAKVSLTFVRGDKPLSAEVELARQPEALPNGWMTGASPEATADQTPSGPMAAWVRTEIRIPEDARPCVIWTSPVAADRPMRQGLIVWLAPPGAFTEAACQTQWEDSANAHGFALIAPRPLHDDRWDGEDLEYVRKTVEQALKAFPLDPQRLVIVGQGAGGGMAYLFAFANRHLARGVAVWDATIPARLELRGNDPENRLRFLHLVAPQGMAKTEMHLDAEQLRGMKFPVWEWSSADDATTGQPAPVVTAWADTLDSL